MFDLILGFGRRSKFLLDQDDVDTVPSLDKEKGLTLEEFKQIKIHMTNCNSLDPYFRLWCIGDFSAIPGFHHNLT